MRKQPPDAFFLVGGGGLVCFFSPASTIFVIQSFRRRSEPSLPRSGAGALASAAGDNALLSPPRTFSSCCSSSSWCWCPDTRYNLLPSSSSLRHSRASKVGAPFPDHRSSKTRTSPVLFNKRNLWLWLFSFSRTPVDTKSYSATSAKPREPAVRPRQDGTADTGTRQERWTVGPAERRSPAAALSSPFSAAFLLFVSAPSLRSETRARR